MISAYIYKDKNGKKVYSDYPIDGLELIFQAKNTAMKPAEVTTKKVWRKGTQPKRK